MRLDNEFQGDSLPMKVFISLHSFAIVQYVLSLYYCQRPCPHLSLPLGQLSTQINLEIPHFLSIHRVQVEKK